jgi:hypothetical protein
MGFSRSAQVSAQRAKNDRQFVRDTAIPYGNIAASNAVESLGSSTNILSLRAANSDATQSRMALPISDVAKSGSESFGKNTQLAPNTQSSLASDFDLYNKLSDRSLQDRGAMGNQDIDLTKRKIREVDTLANNEANRAYGMQLATQFPYKKYETESSSAREIMNNAQSAIPTFLNRATASRLNPVSLSL